MALDPANIGRTFAGATSYLVGREKLREFARAVGETAPVCHDLAAARAAGFADLVAPVTFPITITLEMMGDAVTNPSVGLNWSRVVHSDQRFRYERPIVAGDELSVLTTIEDVKAMAGNDIVSLRADLTDAGGALVAQVWTTLAARGED